MNLLCTFFGHRPEPGWGRAEGRGYFSLRYEGTDGLGVEHYAANARCRRCGSDFQVGMIHAPRDAQTPRSAM